MAIIFYSEWATEKSLIVKACGLVNKFQFDDEQVQIHLS